jgi:GrpB-like predicted nucleotidyltransferase (UPF0157 family)
VIEQECRLRELLPGARVQLSGSSSVPDLEAADIDLVALVDDVAAAAVILSTAFPELYPDDWRDDWAAFRDPGPPQVDIVLTQPGSLGDKHHRLAWELLAARPDLLAEYRELKTSPGDYERRKREFFERVVAQL